MMKHNKNVWGLFPLNELQEQNSIHPEDLERMKQLFPHCKVFQCIGEDAEYLLISYGQEIFRVNPVVFKPVPPLPFGIGATVREKARSAVIGEVYEIKWHYKEALPMFFLTVGGKKKSRSYWADELQAITA